MRRLLTGAIVTAIMAAGMAAPVSAGHDPTNACNGLDGTVALIDRRARPADDIWAVRSDRCDQFVERRRDT
jgi:hypothetical protein